MPSPSPPTPSDPGTTPPDTPSTTPDPTYTKKIEDVRSRELKQVQKRRSEVHDDPRPVDPGNPLKAGLVGLAFSGGGIRSGTFNLGILQALGRLKLLTRIDYLSTVSGGGYIGAWLAAWIHRAQGTGPQQKIESVQTYLNSQWDRTPNAPAPKAEPEPIQHLREHSRYLAINSSFLSLDLWALVTIYVRNLFINLTTILPGLLLVVFLCRFLIAFLQIPPMPEPAPPILIPLAIFLSCLLIPNVLFRESVREVQLEEARTARSPTGTRSERARKAGPAEPLPQIGFAVAMLITGFLSVWLPLQLLELKTVPEHEPELYWRFAAACGSPSGDIRSFLGWLGGYFATGLFFALLLLLAAGVARLRPGAAQVDSELSGWPYRRAWLRLLAARAVNGFAFGVAYTAVVKNAYFYEPVIDFQNDFQGTLFVTFGPPLFLIAVLAAGYLEVAVAGRAMGEFEREWRSRIAALLFRTAFAWVLVVGTLAYIPYGLRELSRTLSDPTGRKAPWIAAVGWLITTLAGFFAARRSVKSDKGWLMFIATRLVPLVFLIGLVAIASELSLIIVRPEWVEKGGPPESYVKRLEATDWGNLAWAVFFFAIGATLAAYLIPATLFSLHSLYMNRLTRCYLGASRTAAKREPKGPGLPSTPVRTPNQFNGFDPRDDLPLTDLRTEGSQVYPGPYPLFNTTLNLVGGQDLAYQDRKGGSFVLTPDYCGSRETGYARLVDLDVDAKYNLTLGRAMTISGAAIDPNMNVHQSPIFTAFLTVLNARLGWWLQNPNLAKPQWIIRPPLSDAHQTEFARWKVRPPLRGACRAIAPWTAAPPLFGARYYLQELFGYTTAERDHVHLSDGGHFDNSGVYELIQRRCRYIIAIDAAEDTDDASENLANLIRLVRADFGISIEIDTSPLRKDAKGLSKSHVAIGVIRYDEVDPHGVAGTFVFIRASMTGDESADLRNYANTNPPFPHHSTIDQFFDEVQFESYRKLGEHIGLSVFGSAVEDATRLAKKEDSKSQTIFNRWLFSELRRWWAPLPPGGLERYVESCRDYLALSNAGVGRGNPRVTRSLYPEWRHFGGNAQMILADLQAIDRLFQTMELAWLGNRLDESHPHPLNRGWMNTLRRWTASDEFHTYWVLLRPMYSRGFVRFCERTLNMPDLPVRWCCIIDPARDPWRTSLTELGITASIREPWKTILEEFDKEFAKEWSEILQEKMFEDNRTTYISHAVRASRRKRNTRLAWVLTIGKTDERRGKMEPTEWRLHHIPLGVVVAFPHLEASNVWELLVWIRPGYRSSGLARQSMSWLLPELERALPTKVQQLRVRYPDRGLSGGDHIQQILWTWFFNDLGFVRGSRSTGDLILVKDLSDPAVTRSASSTAPGRGPGRVR